VFHLSKYPLYPNQPSFHLVRYLGKHCQCESCSHCGFTFDWRPVPIAIPGNRSLDIVRLSKECWLFLLKAFAHRIGSPMTSARALCFFLAQQLKPFINQLAGLSKIICMPSRTYYIMPWRDGREYHHDISQRKTFCVISIFRRRGDSQSVSQSASGR